MKVRYEWDLERCGREDGEVIVIDHNHADKLSGFRPADVVAALAKEKGDGEWDELVLVCDTFAYGDLDERGWAYVTPEGALPEWLLDAAGSRMRKVPKQYHEELARFRRTN